MSDQTIVDPSLEYHTYTRGEYTISTDPARLDVDVIYGYLSRSYWATGRPRQTLELSLRHSLNFGVYHQSSQNSTQVGLARIITDYATFAYLCDVFILEENQGHGLGKWLIDTMVNDPALQNIRRFMLATRDAHGLYAQFGFTAPLKPEIWMERIRS
ncbi:MAG: GNAT family N-acetyltransferase [Caldilineaceae bacterium]|nr:GNAT family N-acetyltransferase [Caldilineaceae bacterium]